MTTTTTTTPAADIRTIRRDGKLVTLHIEKYEGRSALAYDEAGQPWIKTGHHGWSPARITVR